MGLLVSTEYNQNRGQHVVSVVAAGALAVADNALSLWFGNNLAPRVVESFNFTQRMAEELSVAPAWPDTTAYNWVLADPNKGLPNRTRGSGVGLPTVTEGELLLVYHSGFSALRGVSHPFIVTTRRLQETFLEYRKRTAA